MYISAEIIIIIIYKGVVGNNRDSQSNQQKNLEERYLRDRFQGISQANRRGYLRIASLRI
jgi:hypothetical protein